MTHPSLRFFPLMSCAALLVALWTGVSSGQGLRRSSTEDLDSCDHQLAIGENLAHYKAFAESAYDTLTGYIFSCHDRANSYQAFGSLGAAVDRINTAGKFQQYREWLLSVLYLNHSDPYYCADVDGIIGTYAHDFFPESPLNYNAEIAVLDYLIGCGRCPDLLQGLQEGRVALRKEQLMLYRDSVVDSMKTPIDTTIPSLQSLGLGRILSESGVVPAAYKRGKEILSLTSSLNPFRSSTEITFELGVLDVAQIEVYDVLGRRVFASDRKAYDRGPHSITFDAAGGESGTLYVRLSTAMGDTRTMKLTLLR